MVEGGKKNAPRWTIFVGKDGKVLHVDKAVKPRSHGADVAARLEQLEVDEK